MSQWIPDRGSRVIIKRGAEVYSYHPRRAEPIINKRRREVVVHGTLGWGGQKARLTRAHMKDLGPSGIQARWAGQAGYFAWTTLENVEPAPSDLEKLAAVGKSWRKR